MHVMVAPPQPGLFDAQRSSGNPSGMHVPARFAAYRRHVDLRRQASALCPATV